MGPGLQISKYGKSIHHDSSEGMTCVVVGRDVSSAGPHEYVRYSRHLPEVPGMPFGLILTPGWLSFIMRFSRCILKGTSSDFANRNVRSSKKRLIIQHQDNSSSRITAHPLRHSVSIRNRSRTVPSTSLEPSIIDLFVTCRGIAELLKPILRCREDIVVCSRKLVVVDCIERESCP